MRCTPISLGNGVTGIVCTSRTRVKPCRQCGARSARLCDYALMGRLAGKTCDMPLCAKCAVKVGPDRDLCRAHAELERAPAIEEARIEQLALEFTERHVLTREVAP